MCVILKTRCFYSFTFNLQSKLKTISPLFLRQLPRKTRYKIQQGFISWVIWVGDPRNFQIFFVKNCSSQKRSKPHKNCLKQQEAEEKLWKKEKEKRKMRKCQTTQKSSFTFCTHCLCSHIYIFWSRHKQLNGDLKGIIFVIHAVHELVALMSSS